MKHPINRGFRDVVNITLRKMIALESHIEYAFPGVCCLLPTQYGRDLFTIDTPRPRRWMSRREVRAALYRSMPMTIGQS
jgi:hypothetical protein